MTFDEWYSMQKHQLSNEAVCRMIWESALREQSERNCIWTPLPDEIDAYEGCASIHHVGRDDEGPTLPAYCSDCGGAVVEATEPPAAP